MVEGRYCYVSPKGKTVLSKLPDFVAVRSDANGPSRHFAATQQSVALGGEADLRRLVQAATALKTSTIWAT
jgi:hypothetical protein